MYPQNAIFFSLKFIICDPENPFSANLGKEKRHIPNYYHYHYHIFHLKLFSLALFVLRYDHLYQRLKQTQASECRNFLPVLLFAAVLNIPTSEIVKRSLRNYIMFPNYATRLNMCYDLLVGDNDGVFLPTQSLTQLEHWYTTSSRLQKLTKAYLKEWT